MHAIIPVAGIGTRLRPHTYTVPKALLNVAGKPIVGHILDVLIAGGVRRATLVVGYKGDMIEEYVRKNYTIDLAFVEQPEALGLGHAIYVAREQIAANEPLVIMLGDTIVDADIKKIFLSVSTSIGVFHAENPERFGVVVSKGGFISKLVEKPKEPISQEAIAGIYFIKNGSTLKRALEELIAKNIRTRNEYQLTDALELMLEAGEKMTTFTVDGWYDCGIPETLLETNRHLLSKLGQAHSQNGIIVNPPSFIAPDAKVTNSIIGPHATIAARAVVDNSVVRNSIISEEATVCDALLENSIVGANAVVQGSFKRINAGDSSIFDFN